MMRCSGYKDYECVDGTCASSGYSCKQSSSAGKKCDHYQYDYLCPDGECAKSDAGCLRPCGTHVNGDIYQYVCSGFSQCRASNGHDCPAVCGVTTPYKCADQDCVKNEKFCKRCYGFRCDDGDCTYSYMDKCNSRVDCSDGSDESESACSPAYSSGISTGVIVAPAIIIVVIIIMIIILIVVLARRRRLGQSGGARAQSGAQPIVTSGVPARPLATMQPATSPPYPNYPQNQQYPPAQTNQYATQYAQPGGFGYGGGAPAQPQYQPVAQYPQPYGASAPPAPPPPGSEQGAPPSYNEVVRYGNL